MDDLTSSRLLKQGREIRTVLRCVGGYAGVVTMSRRAEMVEVNSIDCNMFLWLESSVNKQLHALPLACDLRRDKTVCAASELNPAETADAAFQPTSP